MPRSRSRPRPDPGPSLERFEYLRVGDEWAVLRLLARMRDDLQAPADAHLLLDNGAGRPPLRVPARAIRAERHLGDPPGTTSLAWQSAVAVPAAIVEHPDARFALLDGHVRWLDLPAPAYRLTPRPPRTLVLSLSSGTCTTLRLAARSRRRAAVLASAAALTTTASPGIAFAGTTARGGAIRRATSTMTVGHAWSPGASAGDATSAGPSAASAPTGTTTATTAAATTATEPTTAGTTPTASAPQATATTPTAATEATTAGTTTATTTTTAATTAGTTTTAGTATTRTTTATTASTAATASTGTTSTTTASAKATTTIAGATAAKATATAGSTKTTLTGPIATTATGLPTTVKRGTAHVESTPTTHHVRRASVPATSAVAGESCVTSGFSTAAGSNLGGTADTRLATQSPATSAGTATATETATSSCPPGTAATTTSHRSTAAGRSTAATTGASSTQGDAPEPTTSSDQGGAAAIAFSPATPQGRRERVEQAAARTAALARRAAAAQAAARMAAEARRAAERQGTSGATTTSTTTTGTGASSTGSTGYTGPASWTGTVDPDPVLTGVVNNLSGWLSDGDRPPSFLIPIYVAAGEQYHVPWEVLAAINSVETDYGRDLSTSTAGAVGWMQFEPGTWREYGVAVDGASEPNPYDPRDAIFAAARYLAANDGANDIRTAIYAYNHADWYVDEVMSRAQAIASQPEYESLTRAGNDEVSAQFAIQGSPRTRITYHSGILSHYDRLIAAANMVSAANFPYLWGGGHEQPAAFGPFDCSGSVSYVMQQAGYGVDTTVAADVGSWGLPKGPGQVTIFYNDVHTFMRIGDRYFGTSGFARPGGGAGWFDVDRLPASYLAEFHEVHVPDLGVDSFADTPTLQLVSYTPRRTARQRVRDAAQAAIAVFQRQRLSFVALRQALSHPLSLLPFTGRGAAQPTTGISLRTVWSPIDGDDGAVVLGQPTQLADQLIALAPIDDATASSTLVSASSESVSYR